MTDLTVEERVRQLEGRQNASRWRGIVGGCVVAGTVCAILLYQIALIQRQQESLAAQSRAQLFWRLCQPSTSAAERTAAFTQLVADGHSEWRSAVCRDLALQGSILDGASLRLVDLSACDLRDATLVKADLTAARLRTVDFRGADLTEATLDGAECLKAVFDDADCHRALMRSILLEQVSARQTRFVLADLSEAVLLMADLTGADMTGANLTAATLESANLRGATLALSNLAEANLRNANLTDSNWWRARGLSRDQLIRFAAEFPPTDAADPSRIEDYLLWTNTLTSTEDTQSAQRPESIP